MDDEDNDYELERQRTIAENRALLDSLGLDPSGSSKIPFTSRPSSKPSSIAGSTTTRKRKPAPAAVIDEGPRRRSGRLLGLEAEGETLKLRLEAEEKEREVLRIVNRKEREKVMDVGKMVEEPQEGEVEQLESYLSSISSLSNPRAYPSTSTTGKEAYAESDTIPAEVQRLKSAFKGMSLKANAKVTSERVYTMAIHPEKTKTLVLVGDKYGQLGIWDALGPAAETIKSEDDTSGLNGNGNGEGEDDGEGRVWRVQAHAKNSITCMKVDPVNGSGLFSSSYDCSLRHLSFSTLKSTELFAFADEDMLVTHFDLVPSGQEAWLADKNGGLTHVDFREDNSRRKRERRRWVVQEEGRAAKLGGVSVNPLMPHLLVTAGNDQHLRIWDSRHLTALPITPIELPTPPPSTKSEPDGGESANNDTLDTRLNSQTPYEKIEKHMSTAKGKGLLRASFKHGKSCSAAYWDPWGRRVLTTSYDDKLRVWMLNPQSLLLDTPLPPNLFQPSKIIPHNCQTGRWLTILRAQWSNNMDYMPHFTIGNMKRTLDVVSCTGEKIVSLWNDAVTAVPAVSASHPSLVDHVVGGNTSGRIQLWSADRLRS